MNINTHFSCGDKAWAFDFERNCPRHVTVGHVSFSFNKRDGLKESYMCHETGIGSGTVYTYGEHIFDTEDECTAAFQEMMQKIKKEREDDRQRQIDWAMRELQRAQRKLAELTRQS